MIHLRNGREKEGTSVGCCMEQEDRQVNSVNAWVRTIRRRGNGNGYTGKKNGCWVKAEKCSS